MLGWQGSEVLETFDPNFAPGQQNVSVIVPIGPDGWTLRAVSGRHRGDAGPQDGQSLQALSHLALLTSPQQPGGERLEARL